MQIPMTDGRMAQLVEHFVHIEGVTGSSPVATTFTWQGYLPGFFAFIYLTPAECLLSHTELTGNYDTLPSTTF
jgi:hypothetical protein